MNGFILMVPLFLIRFGLLGFVYKPALKRAAFFAPLQGGEKTAYIFYQISNFFLVLFPLCLKVKIIMPYFLIGISIYIVGILILISSTVAFAKPNQTGLNTDHIYRFSRNPMYAGYFLFYLGCAVLSRSVLLLGALVVFQASAHWIILSEERWCAKEFGEEYTSYMSRVRRYI